MKSKIPLIIWACLACAILLIAYFRFFRRVLPSSTSFWMEVICLAALALSILAGLLLLLSALARWLLMNNPAAAQKSLASVLPFLLAALVLLVVFVAASQWSAYTPPITAAGGAPRPESIASLEKVRLGGVDQWLILRGRDVNKPVLLFLSGGPGASEAARVLRFNQDLEEHFVVAIWEQRGCGKSYPAGAPLRALTVEQYTSDLIELVEMLRPRFDEQKIYLVGHSWGTIIGVRAAQARPELFHAYVGTAQMVNVLETDRIIYRMVLDHARQNGDTAFVQTLETQGEPPYLGKSPIRPYSTLFGREYAVFEVPNIKNEEYRREGDILLLMLKQPEYGWLDRVYYLLGLMNTFNAVYPQLQEMDFRLDATQLEVPVYLVQGRHDMNNPSQLPEDYFQQLKAPLKRLDFFEDSGHGMIWEEASRFTDLMVRTVLPDTYTP